MKIEGKLSADIKQVIVKQNQSNDGREAFIDLDAGVTKDEAEKKFGEDFATMAFSTMRVMEADPDAEDDVDAIAFLVDSIKPGSRVVFELHTIDIDGEEVVAQPELRGVKTVDGEARVIAQLRVPVDVSKKALLNQLVGNVGKTVKIGFIPVQGSLGFEAAKGNGNMRVVKGVNRPAEVEA